MKRIILLLSLVTSMAYGQVSNTTPTNFTNSLEASRIFNLPALVATPPVGIKSGGLSYNTTLAKLASWNGTAWVYYLTELNAQNTYVPLTRTITINGVSQDLSVNRNWTISSSIGSLQQTTDIGNTTDRGILITGQGGISGGVGLNLSSYSGDGTQTSIIRNEQGTYNTEIAHTASSGGTGSIDFNINNNNSLKLRNPNGTGVVAGAFNGRVSGSSAVNAKDFVTLDQIPASTGGTVTNFSKTDGFGITSAVTNPTTTPNHSIAVDSTQVRTVNNSLSKSQVQTALNTKQNQLSGTGFVKATGSTISYDNTSYYPSSNPNGYTSNTGTVTSFSKTDGFGVVSSVATPTTTPNHTVSVDTTIISSKENVRTFKDFQDYSSYSSFANLGLDKQNSGFILIGDSNSEGYTDNDVGVSDNNWFNILSKNIQKTQGKNSGVGYTDFLDPTRYGFALSGTTSIVSSGPTNTALQMAPNSNITFTSATNLVEVWFNGGVGTGRLEFYYNGVLYRTIDCSLSNGNNIHTFINANYPSTITPSGANGTYTIKCTTANVVVTALFPKVLFSEGFDTYFFLRQAVAGKTFQNFNLSNIKATTGIGSDNNSLYLLALGTNSIYNSSTATTATQYGIDITNYINALKTASSNVVYLMPPRSTETTYPPIIEPYINYYNTAKQICLSMRIPFIDLNDAISSNTAISIYGSDGLHYSAYGHSILAKIILNRLSKININTLNEISYNNTVYPVKLGGDDLNAVLTRGNTSSLGAIFGNTIQVVGNAANGPGSGAFLSVGNNLSGGAQRAAVSQLGLDGDLVTYLYNGSTFTERMRINNSNGYVGIGNSAIEALDVTGKIRASVAPTNPTDVVRLQDLTGFGGGTVVSVATTSNNGISGIVTNPTSTPSIALTADTTVLRTAANSLTKAQLQTKLNGYETISNKQNSLAPDGTNLKYPTVTAVNSALANYITTNTTQTGLSGDKTWVSGSATWGNFASVFTNVSSGQVQVTNSSGGSTTIVRPSTINFQPISGVAGDLQGPSSGGTSLLWTLPPKSGTIALVSDLPQYISVPSSTTSVGLVGNTTYGFHATTLTTATLPATNPAEGTLITLIGIGSGQFRISQNASQYIVSGNATTTVGTAGYIQTTTNNTTITIRYLDTNRWQVTSSNSAPTIN